MKKSEEIQTSTTSLRASILNDPIKRFPNFELRYCIFKQAGPSNMKMCHGMSNTVVICSNKSDECFQINISNVTDNQTNRYCEKLNERV